MKHEPIIDTDVHHSWRSEAELRPYLPQPWRDLATGTPFGGGQRITAPYRFSYRRRYGGVRIEAYPPNGEKPGSKYSVIRDQLLERYNVERALLTFDTALNNGLPNPYYAQAIVRAINDWNIDHWLSIPDERLVSAVLIPAQFPREGAQEIRRVGEHPRIVAALLGWNALSKPLGHQIYHPIYEAAAEMGLPIVLHTAAGEHAWGPTQFNAGGLPGNYFEMDNVFTHPMLHHLASFIVHGVFEKYPKLKVLSLECGLSWIPWLIWNLDDHYRVLKRESPLLKRLPSEYFRDHVRFSTQPLELSPERAQLIQVLEAFGGIDDMLCFSTDYPHWDADDPRYVGGRLPRSWRRKVFYENARQLFRWPAGAVPGVELAEARA